MRFLRFCGVGFCLLSAFLTATLPALAGGHRADFGIKEVIPAEFRERYQRWKNEFLSTEFGLHQWNHYANNKSFLLKIVIDPEKKFGAGTDDYEWGAGGELVGATITLGKNLDRGYPDPVYYPVMNALSALSLTDDLDGSILASAKIAHEFGHVSSTAQIDGGLFQRQDRLMASYYAIFLRNGYNTSDPRLMRLQRELGRQPIEIWEDREYWGETSAMRFLADRMNKYSYCSVLAHIMRNVTFYAKTYEERFGKIAASSQPPGCRYQ